LRKVTSGHSFFHIAAGIQQHRDGAQGAHDAADAQRIGDGLAQAVLLGDLEVDHRAGLVPANLEHADGVIGAIQGGAPVEGGLDARVRAQHVRDPL
jgi:hypothetical protein